jgi:hypothetical protein
MSASSSSTTPIEPTCLRRPEFVLHTQTQTASCCASDDTQGPSLAPRPGITRHYTSLQEHADAVRQQSLTSGGGDVSTPRAEERREGFTWEVHKDADTPSSPNLEISPAPNTPPSMDEIMCATAEKREKRGEAQSFARTDSYQSMRSTTRVSTGSSLNSTVSRSDTNRSSISGIARGFMRHASDMRAFLPLERQHEDDEDASIRGRRGSKVGRQLQFDLPRPEAEQKKQKEEAPRLIRPPPEKTAFSHKATLKDRRKIEQGESMKLTLPSNIPELPSRGRTPVVELNSIVPSCPRSPKTPWVHEHHSSWPSSGLATAPATIIENSYADTPGLLPGHDLLASSQTPQSDVPGGRTWNRRSLPRLRFGRTRSWARRSDSPLRSAEGNFPVTKPLVEPTQTQMEHAQYAQQVKTREELKEVGKRSRCRRLRWSGPWSSTGNSEPPDTPSPGRTSFFLTRMLRPMRSCQPDDASSTETPTYEKAQRRRKRHADMEKIANMPVPPIFIPPGTSRVPTPPMLDANGEIKGKLADFFFNIEDVRMHKPPTTPGGIWDSDAVLMSQTTDISPPSSESDESPQAIGISPIAGDDVTPAIAITTPNATYFNVAVTPPALVDPLGSETWFRMPKASLRRDSKQFNTRVAEEKAKLEWLIPEHLPNSPLCPLHVKYVGPSSGVCVFHERRQSGSGAKAQRKESDVGAGKRNGAMDGSGEEFGWAEAWTFRAGRRRKRVSSSGCSP